MSSDPREHFLHRRHLLCGGGSFVFAAMMTSLLGGSKPVRAQTIAGSGRLSMLFSRVRCDASLN
jgi:hypothetical protein